eukprot:355040_1
MTLDSEQQAIEESWTPVKNLKKERYEDRKRRDAQEQAEIAQAEAQSREDSIPSQNDGDFTEVNAEVDAWSTPNVAKQSFPQQTSKSRKKGNKSTKKKIIKATNEADLVTLLKDLILREFKHDMPIAELGARMHEHTGSSWNKVYKPKYGTMVTFIQKNSETFACSDSRVFLRSEMSIEEKESSSPRLTQPSDKPESKKRDKKSKRSKKSTKKSTGSPSVSVKSSQKASKSSSAACRAAMLLAVGSAMVAGAAFYVLQVDPAMLDEGR